MLDHISTLEQLEEEALEIDKFLQITCSEDANEAVYRGNELNIRMARTGKMLADARYHKDVAYNTTAKKWTTINHSLSATALNKVIDSSCKHENYMVNWLERLNRTCTHQQAFMITLISKAKAEMQMNNRF